ncbi:MAG: diphthine--ammonia ligase [Terracidiphilus sp.]
MTNRHRALISWSGGKDCCLAAHRAKDTCEPVGLITMLTEDGARSRSHGLRLDSLQAQASALQLPLWTANASWDCYESEFIRLLSAASRELRASHVIFGDVFPESHKQWAERVCRECQLTALEPLWAQPTDSLVREFMQAGGDARIVTVRDKSLPSSWLGRQLNEPAIEELIAAGIDPCGENGEYHTFVAYFPGFRQNLDLKHIAIAQHGGCSMLNFVVE